MGGRYQLEHFQYDHVKQGKRQVGSTFKPFVYATAIMNLSMTPCSTVSNATISAERGYTVPGRGGNPALKQALAQSLNPVCSKINGYGWF